MGKDPDQKLRFGRRQILHNASKHVYEVITLCKTTLHSFQVVFNMGYGDKSAPFPEYAPTEVSTRYG